MDIRGREFKHKRDNKKIVISFRIKMFQIFEKTPNIAGLLLIAQIQLITLILGFLKISGIVEHTDTERLNLENNNLKKTFKE